LDILTYASLQVVIDGQAWLYAVLKEGGDAPEDLFKAAMTEYKEETEELINSRVADLVETVDVAADLLGEEE